MCDPQHLTTLQAYTACYGDAGDPTLSALLADRDLLSTASEEVNYLYTVKVKSLCLIT
jgi:hypothetical protein